MIPREELVGLGEAVETGECDCNTRQREGRLSEALENRSSEKTGMI